MEMFARIVEGGRAGLSASCICLETVPTWTHAAFYINVNSLKTTQANKKLVLCFLNFANLEILPGLQA